MGASRWLEASKFAGSTHIAAMSVRNGFSCCIGFSFVFSLTMGLIAGKVRPGKATIGTVQTVYVAAVVLDCSVQCGCLMSSWCLRKAGHCRVGVSEKHDIHLIGQRGS